MRLWSLRLKYLDAPGLVVLWQEALLAQAVSLGETRGHRSHPQLLRFRHQIVPVPFIVTYLQHGSAEEVIRRGRFNASRISPDWTYTQTEVSTGQLEFELPHLTEKLRKRNPERYTIQLSTAVPAPHPLFNVVPGAVASWECGAWWRGPLPLRDLEDFDASAIVLCRAIASRRSARRECHRSNLGRCLRMRVS